jgi:hypothetical protein
VVILSLEILTFHNFSEALIDADATNAIYLVGSSGYLRANNSIYILWE